MTSATDNYEIPVMRDIFQIAGHPNATNCWSSNGEEMAEQKERFDEMVAAAE